MPGDTWKMHETGFRIGCGKAQWVITRDAKKALVMTGPDNREYITSSQTINAAGRSIPPLIIFSGKQTLYK